MRTDVPRLNVDQTVGEALLAIREKPPMESGAGAVPSIATASDAPVFGDA